MYILTDIKNKYFAHKLNLYSLFALSECSNRRVNILRHSGRNEEGN